LGKCLNEKDNVTWHENPKGLVKRNFNYAIKEVMKSYEGHKNKYSLCDSLRNGMSHAFQPKQKIELSDSKDAIKKGWKHLESNSDEKLVLICEPFYSDFQKACIEVVRRIDSNEFDKGGKMYKPFLKV
jgi:hypothetical protein